MGRRALILGASGQIGRAISERLAAEGWSVLAAHRGTHAAADVEGVQSLLLDRDDDAALKQAVGGGVDALIDVIAFEERHARQLLEVQADVGVFVVISSGSVYSDAEGRTFGARDREFPRFINPVPETAPTVPPGPETYSTRKAAIEQILLNESRIPATMLRAGTVYGAGSRHAREWWFIKRMLDGRTRIPLVFDGASRFHPVAAVNIAALCRTVLDKPGTRALNAGDPTAPNVAEIGEAVAAALGMTPPDFVGLPGRPKGGVGATPWSIPNPFVMDMTAAAALGYRPVGGYADLVPAACRAFIVAAGDDWRTAFPVLAGYSYDLFDYAAEDRMLAAEAAG